jgi:hypothetical protein
MKLFCPLLGDVPVTESRTWANFGDRLLLLTVICCCVGPNLRTKGAVPIVGILSTILNSRSSSGSKMGFTTKYKIIQWAHH